MKCCYKFFLITKTKKNNEKYVNNYYGSKFDFHNINDFKINTWKVQLCLISKELFL